MLSYNSISSSIDENTETVSSINVINLKQKQTDYVSKLKILCKNCQSVVNKKHESQMLLVDQNPDIVTATESWLNKEHYNNEIFPADFGYTVLRHGRPKGKGGGCLSLLRTTSYIVNKQT